MGYNYNFALGSVLFLGLTAAFYLRQRRMRDMQDHLFTIMLFGGLAAVFFDFLAAAVEPGALALPVWFLYLINMLFVLGEHICLPAFFLYTLVATEHFDRLTRPARLAVLLPFAIVVCLLALSPFGTSGIFYIDGAHIYRPGATHWVLYAVAGLYMALSCVMLITSFRNTARVKRVIILLFAGLIFLAMLVQIYLPRYLLVTSAAALALTAMYYVMRAPGEQVDPFTGAFCRVMLPSILKNLREKNKRCTLVLYSVLNYDEIARTHGTQLSDGLLASLSDWLRARYRGGAVVYMNGAEFAVVTGGVLDAEALRAIRQQAPAALAVDDSDIRVQLALAAIVHHDGDAAESTINAIDFLFRQMREERSEELLIADAAFQERCERLARLESSMDRIVREGDPVLLTQPVQYAHGAQDSAPAMLDVSLSLRHGELDGVTPGELLTAIRQSGNTRWYYERLCALTGAKAQDTDGSVRFCLPLFAAVLIQDEMADMLFDLVTDAGMDPRRIVLRLSEDDVQDELPVVSDNIRRLAAFGFGFRLDGFAEGYTDVSLLSDLPIGTVMIDRSLIKNARGSARSQALLGCVIRILVETGKEVVCAGVDSAGDAAAARAVGAPMLHGKWCVG